MCKRSPVNKPDESKQLLRDGGPYLNPAVAEGSHSCWVVVINIRLYAMCVLEHNGRLEGHQQSYSSLPYCAAG